jgi:hypothetical protein
MMLQAATFSISNSEIERREHVTLDWWGFACRGAIFHLKDFFFFLFLLLLGRERKTGSKRLSCKQAQGDGKTLCNSWVRECFFFFLLFITESLWKLKQQHKHIVFMMKKGTRAIDFCLENHFSFNNHFTFFSSWDFTRTPNESVFIFKS